MFGEGKATNKIFQFFGSFDPLEAEILFQVD